MVIRKIITIVLLATIIWIFKLNYALAVESTDKESLFANTILKTSFVSKIELVMYASAHEEVKQGETRQAINIGKIGEKWGIAYFEVLKKDGFFCKVFVGDKIICERENERFEYVSSYNDGNPGARLFYTLTDKSGGELPFANIYLSLRNAIYEKDGSILKVKNKEGWSLTVNLENGSLIKYNLPKNMKEIDLVNLVTSQNFQKKINIIPENFTLEREIPYTDLGDILNMLVKFNHTAL